MRGVIASVTSCIGGKDERYAVKIQSPQRDAYYLYKTMGEFEALWAKMEAIAEQAKLKQQLFVDDGTSQDVSVLAKWLMSFADHFAFRTTIEQLREQSKETITPLNVLVQALVRRVQALYVESTILRCGCCQVGRQLARLVRNFLEFYQYDTSPKHIVMVKPVTFELPPPLSRKRTQSEIQPQEDDRQRKPPLPMFPVREYNEPLPKARKVSASEDCMIQKVELHKPVAPLAGRRRVYAEVNFGL